MGLGRERVKEKRTDVSAMVRLDVPNNSVSITIFNFTMTSYAAQDFLSLNTFKGLFTRREGYPCKRGQKIARFYKQNFTGTVSLQPGTT